jgi:TRAP transporter 4TM/12TM fusion protein
MGVIVNNMLLEKSINFFKVIWVLFHFYAIWALPLSINQMIVLHLGFATMFIFHTCYEQARKKEPHNSKNNKLMMIIWLLLFIFMFLVTMYFFFQYRDIINHIGTPTFDQIIAGSTLILLVLIATFSVWGFIIPLLVTAVSIYALFGRYFGGILFHSGIDFARFIGYSATYYMGTLGSLTNYSATLIIHFLLFGTVLQAVGGSEAINKLGKIFGTRFRSGAAQSAVFSSCMMGMVSGSIPANVAITGSFTIPMMKEQGYSPEYAGSIEAVASSGGQIMPPVMSVVAFLIAGMTGMPYSYIVLAAILPALVYYFSLAFNVSIRSQKIKLNVDIKEQERKISTELKAILFEYGYLLIAIIILTWRIVSGESAPRAVFWGSLSLVVLGFINIVIRCLNNKSKNIYQEILKYFHKLYEGLIKGANETAKVAVILASIGIIMETFTTTGFGQRLSYFIVSMAGEIGSFVLTLLVALLVLFFGMGMPSAGAYLISILLVAPTLTRLGFELLSVHMFVFYYSMLSAITPPVCLGILVATGISGGNFLKTALTSLRLALPGFIMPFFFLYKPVILHFRTNPLGALEFNLLLLLASCGLAVAFEGYLLKRIGWISRIICFFAVLLILHPNMLLSYLGALILLLIFILTTVIAKYKNNSFFSKI